MKLTVTVDGKKSRYKKSISFRTLVSVTVLSSLFVLVSSRNTDSDWENLARVRMAQEGINSESIEVEKLKSETSTKLSVISKQLAEMQVSLSQLNSRSQLLAKEINIDEQTLLAYAQADLENDDQSKEFIENVAKNKLVDPITDLQMELLVKSKQLEILERLMMGHHIDEQLSLSGRPIEAGWLSSYYGTRKDPFTGEAAWHKGLDFAGKDGMNIVATGAGIVTWAGDRYGYGKLVEITHGGGLVTRYGHNESINVSIGDVVTKGQVVALMGSTGRSTGPHVHYEVIKNGRHVNPLPYVKKK